MKNQPNGELGHHMANMATLWVLSCIITGLSGETKQQAVEQTPPPNKGVGGSKQKRYEDMERDSVREHITSAEWSGSKTRSTAHRHTFIDRIESKAIEPHDQLSN
jgi:hypothetical protein